MKPNPAHRIDRLSTRPTPILDPPSPVVGGRGGIRCAWAWAVDKALALSSLGINPCMRGANLKWPWPDRDLTVLYWVKAHASWCEYVLHLVLIFWVSGEWRYLIFWGGLILNSVRTEFQPRAPSFWELRLFVDRVECIPRSLVLNLVLFLKEAEDF